MCCSLAPRSPRNTPVVLTRVVECSQMDQIISVVGEVYSMQLEVDAALRSITVRPTLRFLESVCLARTVGWRGVLRSHRIAHSQAEGIVRPSSSLGQSIDVSVSTDYVNSLSDSAAGAMDDGVLTPEELQSDPEGQAMLDALQQQIADQLGVDPSRVVIDGLNVDGSGRRLQQAGMEEPAKLAGWAFCPTLASCTVDVAYQ